MKIKYLLILTSIALSAILVVSMEKFVHKNIPPTKFDPTFRHQIKSQKPDMVLIGNSTLHRNVKKHLLEEELAQHLGKSSYKLSFVSKGSTHSAWQFLALKNQVFDSGIRNIPIIIIDFEDYFLRPLFGTTNGGGAETLHKAMMEDDKEEEFLSMLGKNRVYYLRGFPYIFSQRYAIKRRLFANVTRRTLGKLSLTRNMNPRWLKKSNELFLYIISRRVFSESRFRSGEFSLVQQHGLPERVIANRDNFTKTADQSFLPKILSYKKHYNLIFVLSNTRATHISMKKYVKTFATQLRTYLEQNGVKFIDLNEVPEVQDPSLMHDSRHFNQGTAQEVNTRALAKELKKYL
jgi:hypothetical protein